MKFVFLVLLVNVAQCLAMSLDRIRILHVHDDVVFDPYLNYKTLNGTTDNSHSVSTTSEKTTTVLPITTTEDSEEISGSGSGDDETDDEDDYYDEIVKETTKKSLESTVFTVLTTAPTVKDTSDKDGDFNFEVPEDLKKRTTTQLPKEFEQTEVVNHQTTSKYVDFTQKEAETNKQKNTELSTKSATTSKKFEQSGNGDISDDEDYVEAKTGSELGKTTTVNKETTTIMTKQIYENNEETSGSGSGDYETDSEEDSKMKTSETTIFPVLTPETVTIESNSDKNFESDDEDFIFKVPEEQKKQTDSTEKTFTSAKEVEQSGDGAVSDDEDYASSELAKSRTKIEESTTKSASTMPTTAKQSGDGNVSEDEDYKEEGFLIAKSTISTNPIMEEGSGSGDMAPEDYYDEVEEIKTIEASDKDNYQTKSTQNHKETELTTSKIQESSGNGPDSDDDDDENSDSHSKRQIKYATDKSDVFTTPKTIDIGLDSGPFSQTGYDKQTGQGRADKLQVVKEIDKNSEKKVLTVIQAGEQDKGEVWGDDSDYFLFID